MPRPKRDNYTRYRKHEADEIYHAEMRSKISELRAKGWGPRAIAAHLQVTPAIITQYMNESMERVIELVDSGIDPGQPEPEMMTKKQGRGPGGGTHLKSSTKVLAPLAIPETHKKAWDLRKRMFSFEQIGQMLGISEYEARQAVRRRMNELDQLELDNTDEARNLMVAQIDDMIQAVHPSAVGMDVQGNTQPVILEAIDRIVKLMDVKAKLLGLHKTPKLDITLRLKDWARENEFSEDEVMNVAAEVIASRSEMT